MLTREDFVRQFPSVLKTDRDCEIPMLIEFVKKRAPVGSLLDVGAHWSGHYYAANIRQFIEHYDGIDLLAPDDATKAILNSYYQGNAINFVFEQLYDVVVCASTLEHCGLSTYQGDHAQEQAKLFERCLELARKQVWFSFPLGQKYLHKGDFEIDSEGQLATLERLPKGLKVKDRFFYNQGPQAGHIWFQHVKREVALRVPYMEFAGNQSLCIMEIEK